MGKVVVTGAAGFIGSNLVRALLKLGREVRAIDNVSRGSKQNLAGLDLELVHADLRDYEQTRRAIGESDCVYHLAARVGSIDYLHGGKRPELEALQSNLAIDTNVFRTCIESNVERIVYASSVSVYPIDLQQKAGARFVEPEIYPINPEGGYGWAKLLGEIQLDLMDSCKSSIARIFNAYGEYSEFGKTAQVVPALVRKAIKYPREDFVVWGDGCLPAGEQIFANPEPSAIELLREGDKVLTSSGFAPILKTFARRYSGELYSIRPMGSFPFKVTENHPILVAQLVTKCKWTKPHICRPGCWCLKYHKAPHLIDVQKRWIPAKEVKKGDYLLIPRLKGGSPQIIDLSEFVKSKSGFKENHQKLMKLELNEDWAYLIGLFVADGWTSKQIKGKRKICLALNIDEDDAILEKVKAILLRNGFASYIRKRLGAYEISFNYTWFGRWLDKYVGMRVRTKRIPPIIFNLPIKETASFIQGYMDGDGTETPYTQSIASSNKVLLSQTQMLLTKLGKYGVVFWSSRYDLGRVSYASRNSTHDHWIDQDFVYTPVVSVSSSEFEGSVYNFETPDNTYATPIIVHNSQTRNLIYIGDCVEALLKMEKTASYPPLILNIGNEKTVTIRELAETIVNVSGKDIKMRFDPTKPVGPISRIPDVTQARAKLQWEPSTQLKEGVSRAYQWMEPLLLAA